MKRNTLAAVAALLVVLPWLQTVRADAPIYTVQNLGSYNGLIPTITGINASGQVIGNVSMNFGSMAVRYTDGIGWQALPGLDTAFSSAMGINANGDVVGVHRVAGQARAFRYRNGAVEDIAPLPGGSTTIGFAINDLSEVTGYSDTATGEVVPFVAMGTIATALPTLDGGFAYACGINASGQVAGISLTPTGAQHGIRVDPDAAAPIDIASPDGDLQTVNACAIDAAGHVGGQFGRSSGALHAFRFTSGAGLLDLDTFNSPVSNVESIAAGVSVGWYTLADGVSTRAFAHRDADGSFDLNTRIDSASGWVLGTAKAINESGMIAGEGTLNGVAAVFVATPQNANDTTPPVIAAHGDEAAEAAGPWGATVNYTPPATSDNVDGGGTATCTPVSGSTFAIGSTTVTCTATDKAGNVATPTTFVVVVKDTTPPVITARGDETAEAAGPNGASVSYTAPTTTDAVDGIRTATCAPAPGSTFALGSTTVTCTAKDAAGNAATPTTFKVVVKDTTAPVIATHADVSAEATGANGASVSYTAPATSDAVDGAGTAACSPASGSTFALGSTTVTCTARDAAGNLAAPTTFRIVVADTTAPAIVALSAAPYAIWPANGKMVRVTLSVSATDAVDPSPVCAITTVTGGPASDIAITGPFTASVRATRNADGSVRTYLFTVSCRDQAGNTSLAAVSVSVSKDGQSKVYHYNHRLRQFVEGLAYRYGQFRR